MNIASRRAFWRFVAWLASGFATVFVWQPVATPQQSHGSFASRWEQWTAELPNEDLYKLLWSLPKGGDLHNHHEYSVPMPFWLAGAARCGYLTRVRVDETCPEPQGAEPLQWLTLRPESVAKLPVCLQQQFAPVSRLTEPQRQGWLSALTLDRDDESRDEFFERAVRRLGDLELDAELMADALVVAQRQLQAEQAVYLETQADPRDFFGMTAHQGAEVLRRRLQQPDSRATGVAVRLQLSTLRFSPQAEDDLREAFAFVHREHDLWVGTNLVGREDNPAGAPARFAPVLRELRRKYPDVSLSLHAGESSSADSNVAETIALGAARIGHGTNAYLDPHAMELLRGSGNGRSRVLIEVSLVSSLKLGYVPDLRRHPFPLYLRQGIPVCLNTDDRGIYRSNLTDEYFAAVALYRLSWPEVVRIGRASLEYSFAEPVLKRELLARYDRNVARFQAKFGGADWRRVLAQVEPEASATTAELFRLRRQR